MFKINFDRTNWRTNLIAIGIAAAAAYLGARAGARRESALEDEIKAIADHVHKTDYWTVYGDVQRDLMGKEED